MATRGRPRSAHALVSATPGKAGAGNVGRYLCSCGEEYPGIVSYKTHRASALRAAAIERAARALMEFEVRNYNWVYPNMEDLSWSDIPESIQNKYRARATAVLDAAKIRSYQ